MRFCSSRPIGLSTNAVTIAASKPKHLFSDRATLYSPPPSYTSKLRAVQMRLSPGSNLSMTSPRATRSHLQPVFALMFIVLTSRHRPQERGHEHSHLPMMKERPLRRRYPSDLPSVRRECVRVSDGFEPDPRAVRLYSP